MTYYFFISSLSSDHWRIQKKIHNAREGEKPIEEGKNYWEEMGITQAEYQLILDSVLVASSELKENERQTRNEKSLRIQANGGSPLNAGPDPEMARLALEHGAMIHRMIDTIKTGLGTDDFAKFDQFVRRHWG